MRKSYTFYGRWLSSMDQISWDMLDHTFKVMPITCSGSEAP